VLFVSSSVEGMNSYYPSKCLGFPRMGSEFTRPVAVSRSDCM
jgi:hypothetical protein